LFVGVRCISPFQENKMFPTNKMKLPQFDTLDEAVETLGFKVVNGELVRMEENEWREVQRKHLNAIDEINKNIKK
jgi:hypothetical protein